MPLIETHFCIFCQRKMIEDPMGQYCKPCDAYKGYSRYIFERMYKEQLYIFEYDLAEQKFTLSNEDYTGYGNSIIMESDDLYLITPKNWEKKLPTILVFS